MNALLAFITLLLQARHWADTLQKFHRENTFADEQLRPPPTSCFVRRDVLGFGRKDDSAQAVPRDRQAVHSQLVHGDHGDRHLVSRTESVSDPSEGDSHGRGRLVVPEHSAVLRLPACLFSAVDRLYG